MSNPSAAADGTTKAPCRETLMSDHAHECQTLKMGGVPCNSSQAGLAVHPSAPTPAQYPSVVCNRYSATALHQLLISQAHLDVTTPSYLQDAWHQQSPLLQPLL